jgi:hypothetical protein
MGWLDNLWRRRQRRTTETTRETAEARAAQGEADKPLSGADEADVREELAHEHRDEELLRERRLPPGTG